MRYYGEFTTSTGTSVNLDIEYIYNSNGAAGTPRLFVVPKRVAPVITDSANLPTTASGFSTVGHTFSDVWAGGLTTTGWYIGSNVSGNTFSSSPILLQWTSASKFYIDAELGT